VDPFLEPPDPRSPPALVIVCAVAVFVGTVVWAASDGFEEGPVGQFWQFVWHFAASHIVLWFVAGLGLRTVRRASR
jgi:hypothetical protein